MDARLDLAKQRVAGLIDWLESGIPATESELADYAHRLAHYAKTGPQQGLPFAHETAPDYAGVASCGQRETPAFPAAALGVPEKTLV